MIWLQENWWIAAIIAVIAILIITVLLRRPKADVLNFDDEIATKTPIKAAPKPKPLEPVKPDIIAAEPARFKPLDSVPPAPTPSVAAPAPTPAPVSAQDAALPATPPVDVPAAPTALPPQAAVTAADSPAPVAAYEGDNLRLMKGVGPKLVTMLAALGVTRFDQIAAWTNTDIDRIDPQLGAFQGRIARDNWVDQAGYLANRDKTGFEAKYGALGGEI